MRISDWSSDVCSSDRLDAQPQNVAAERLGAIEFAGLVGVIEDQRVQVAVAGMEHVRYPEAVFFRQLRHPFEHLGQAAARDRAVHAIIIGRDPPHRRKRRLAPGPRSEEHTSELQSLMRNSYSVFCLKNTNNKQPNIQNI